MLTVTTTWNQPCRSIAGAATLYLAIRLTPAPQAAGTAVHGIVLLDLSRSMQGSKLFEACLAVETLWSQLRVGDCLAVVGFNDTGTVLLPWSEKGKVHDSRIRKVLESACATGVTNLHAGLQEALRLALASPAGVGRFIWLVTDGDPTDETGKRASTEQPYLDGVAQAASHGVVFNAIGLGNAEHYRASFLRELADRGRGAFCYAPTLDLLSQQLREQLTSAQQVVAPSARLELELESGNQVLTAARVVPDYVPLALSGGKGKWSLSIGGVAMPETVVLLEVATAAPFLAVVGEREVGVLRVAIDGSGPADAIAPIKLTLRYQRPGHSELLQRDNIIEGLRYSMLLVRNEELRQRARTAEEKLRATEVMIDLAKKTSDIGVVQNLQAEADQLRQNRELTSDQETRMMQDIRATSTASFRKQSRGDIGDGK